MKSKLSLFEITLFPILGCIMTVSKIMLEFLPNIHMIGMFIVIFTIVFRYKALIPIYIFAFLNGIISGFNIWWVPYLYIWTVLWLVCMLLPKNMPTKISIVVYAVVCGLHGLLYGCLYAPFQAIMFGLDFRGMISWIIAGLGFDLIHGIGNFCFGLLIVPLSKVLQKSIRKFS